MQNLLYQWTSDISSTKPVTNAKPFNNVPFFTWQLSLDPSVIYFNFCVNHVRGKNCLIIKNMLPSNMAEVIPIINYYGIEVPQNLLQTFCRSIF